MAISDRKMISKVLLPPRRQIHLGLLIIIVIILACSSPSPVSAAATHGSSNGVGGHDREKRCQATTMKDEPTRATPPSSTSTAQEQSTITPNSPLSSLWDSISAWRRQRRLQWQELLLQQELNDAIISTRRPAASPIAQSKAREIFAMSQRVRIRPQRVASEDTEIPYPHTKTPLVSTATKPTTKATPPPRSRRSKLRMFWDMFSSFFASIFYSCKALLADSKDSTGLTLLAGFLVCLISSVILLRPRRNRSSLDKENGSKGVPTTIHISTSSTTSSTTPPGTVGTDSSTSEEDEDSPKDDNPFTLRLPSRPVWIGYVRMMLNRYTCLAVIYLLVWSYVGWTVQLDHLSGTMRRPAEISPDNAETMLWLNAMLRQFWRVPLKSFPGLSLRAAFEQLSYPEFVIRAVLENKSSQPFGGLEPYLASKIGLGLLENLEKAKGSLPVGISLLSLHSLSLGSRPPSIRRIQMLPQLAEGVIGFDLDIDMSFSDSGLVIGLDLPLSMRSPSAPSLPQARLAIRANDFELPLRIVLETFPSFPFVNNVDISLRNMPDIRIKLRPSAVDVDIGSTPLLREWIRYVTQRSMSHMIEPSRVTMDLSSDLRRHHDFLEYPNSSSPFDHRSARTQEVDSPESPSLRPNNNGLFRQLKSKEILRPKTQVAELALKRWREKQLLGR